MDAGIPAVSQGLKNNLMTSQEHETAESAKNNRTKTHGRRKMEQPRMLTEDKDRQMARRIRDQQWNILERIARQGPQPLFICWWNKDRRHREPHPEDLKVCGLIDGMELASWLRSHPDWTEMGEWDKERCAQPVYITDAGRQALGEREKYDLEPVMGGLMEPGWQATPAEEPG